MVYPLLINQASKHLGITLDESSAAEAGWLFIRGTPFSLLNSANCGRIHLPELQQVKVIYLNLVTSIMILWRGTGRSGALEAPSCCDTEGSQHLISNADISQARWGRAAPDPPIPSFHQALGCAAPHCLPDFWQESKESKSPSQRGAGKEVFNEKHCSPLWFCEQSDTNLINELFKGRHFVHIKKQGKKKTQQKRSCCGW